jgi:hypothetical protein
VTGGVPAPTVVDRRKPGRKGHDRPDFQPAGLPATNGIAGTARVDGLSSVSGVGRLSQTFGTRKAGQPAGPARWSRCAPAIWISSREGAGASADRASRVASTTFPLRSNSIMRTPSTPDDFISPDKRLSEILGSLAVFEKKVDAFAGSPK